MPYALVKFQWNVRDGVIEKHESKKDTCKAQRRFQKDILGH